MITLLSAKEKTTTLKPCNVFAAFEPNHLAAALSQVDLTPSASDLFVYLHAIAPFGSFYSWSKDNGQTLQSVRSALKRRSGKYRGQSMDVRTFQRAKKLLVEKQLLFVSARGFRILQLQTRQPKQGEQLNIFQGPEKRQYDRFPALKALRGGRFGEGKDLKFKDNNKTNTQRPKLVCCPDIFKEEDGSGTEKVVPIRNKRTKPIAPIKKVVPVENKCSAAPTFTKLSTEQSTILFRLGVQPKQINRNLVRAIAGYSLEALNQAVTYTQWRVDRTDLALIPNLIGYFLMALKSKFVVPVIFIPAAEPLKSVLTELQQEWINLACAQGLASSQFKEGIFWIYIDNEALPFEQAIERLPIEQLRSSRMSAADCCPAPLSPAESNAPTVDAFRGLMEALAPKDADPRRDFGLKFAWFQVRVDELGPNDRLLHCWDLFKAGQVVLVQQGTRWCLQRSG